MISTIKWFDSKGRVYFRGRWFDQEMVNAFKEVERLQGYAEQFYQGSYNAGVGASAGTHNKGAVYDSVTRGIANRQRKSRYGIVEWHRTRSQGFMDHGHGMMIGLKTASPALKAQMYDWLYNDNGLVGGARDDSMVRDTFRSYPDWRASLNAKPSSGGGGKKPVVKAPPTAYLDGINKSKKYGSKVRSYYSVKLMQKAMNKIYAGTPLKVDGIYGPATSKLYDRWRKANFKTGTTGTVGPEGLKLLFKRASMKVNVKATTKGKVL